MAGRQCQAKQNRGGLAFSCVNNASTLLINVSFDPDHIGSGKAAPVVPRDTYEYRNDQPTLITILQYAGHTLSWEHNSKPRWQLFVRKAKCLSDPRNGSMTRGSRLQCFAIRKTRILPSPHETRSNGSMSTWPRYSAAINCEYHAITRYRAMLTSL